MIRALVSPAKRAALFTTKPTVKSTLTQGCWTLSDKFDAVGGMTQSAVDLADLICLLQKDVGGPFPASPSRYQKCDW